MPEPIKIRVETTADTAGLKATENAIKSVTAATQAAAKSAQVAKGSTSIADPGFLPENLRKATEAAKETGKAQEEASEATGHHSAANKILAQNMKAFMAEAGRMPELMPVLHTLKHPYVLAAVAMGVVTDKLREMYAHAEEINQLSRVGAEFAKTFETVATAVHTAMAAHRLEIDLIREEGAEVRKNKTAWEQYAQAVKQAHDAAKAQAEIKTSAEEEAINSDESKSPAEKAKAVAELRLRSQAEQQKMDFDAKEAALKARVTEAESAQARSTTGEHSEEAVKAAETKAKEAEDKAKPHEKTIESAKEWETRSNAHLHDLEAAKRTVDELKDAGAAISPANFALQPGGGTILESALKHPMMSTTAAVEADLAKAKRDAEHAQTARQGAEAAAKPDEDAAKKARAEAKALSDRRKADEKLYQDELTNVPKEHAALLNERANATEQLTERQKIEQHKINRQYADTKRGENLELMEAKLAALEKEISATTLPGSDLIGRRNTLQTEIGKARTSHAYQHDLRDVNAYGLEIEQQHQAMDRLDKWLEAMGYKRPGVPMRRPTVEEPPALRQPPATPPIEGPVPTPHFEPISTPHMPAPVLAPGYDQITRAMKDMGDKFTEVVLAGVASNNRRMSDLKSQLDTMKSRMEHLSNV